MRAAQNGDREAFGELYRRFARAAHGVLLARLPPADAEDVVQDVFVQAFTRLRELRQPEAFVGWICAIARRRAVDFHRRHVQADELPEEVPATGNPESIAEAHEALRVIQELPEAYRETLTLRLVEGLSGSEIAASTGLTADSVRVNLHRGFKLLRARLRYQL